MKKAIFIFAVFISTHAIAFDIPKELFGKYQAEVPSFEFEHNDKTIKASSYPVSIYLKSNSLRYECGNLKFFGVYTNLLKGDDLLRLSVHITNEQSIDFNMNLNINQKRKTILMTGLVGVPNVALQQENLVFYKESAEGSDVMKG